LSFVQQQRNHAVIDASQALTKVVADTEKAISATLREIEGKCG
jgi:hypothetical protein